MHCGGYILTFLFGFTKFTCLAKNPPYHSLNIIEIFHIRTALTLRNKTVFLILIRVIPLTVYQQQCHICGSLLIILASRGSINCHIISFDSQKLSLVITNINSWCHVAQFLNSLWLCRILLRYIITWYAPLKYVMLKLFCTYITQYGLLCMNSQPLKHLCLMSIRMLTCKHSLTCFVLKHLITFTATNICQCLMIIVMIL